MMIEGLADNLAAYAIQISVVIVAAALLIRLFRIVSPRARLPFWRVVLAICLFLPVLQPWSPAPDPIVVLEPAPVASDAAEPIAAVAQTASPPAIPVPSLRWSWILLAIAAGIVCRLAWLAVGLATLRRLRRLARLADRSTPAFVDAIALTGGDAEFRISTEVTEPVTFGARRPTVLLPDRFPEFSRAEQTAVVCHELLHVRRHDWLMTIADEIVRTAFWFHPAVWWMLDQIHLCREQVVDRLVVSLIGERQSYLSALWRLVSQPPGAVLRPASAFLGRAHLTQRVALLVKEVPMSKLRLASSLAVIAFGVAAGTAVVVRAFPMHRAASSPTLSTDATDPQPAAEGASSTGAVQRPGTISPPAPPVRAIPRRTRDVEPLYPATSEALKRAEIVALRITVDASGRVTHVEATAGAEPFAQAAIDAARLWEFERPAPSRAPVTLRYLVHFPAPGDVPFKITSRLVTVPEATRVGSAANQTTSVNIAKPKPSSDWLHTPVNVRFRNASLRDVVTFVEETSGIEIRYEGLSIGTTPITIDMEGVQLKSVLDVVLDVAGLTYQVIEPGIIQLVRRDQAERAVIPPAPSQSGPLRVGGNILAPRKIVDVNAVYPELARQAEIRGTVIVEARIGTDGKVKNARVLRSIPLLDQAALDAVSQWEYVPTLLNGVPIDVILIVGVNFPPE